MADFDVRKLMKLAIEEMEKSIHESRQDGKQSPLVGAVLVKQDGTVQTAFRGELREGDHAEYTLLERKNRDSRLDGSTLFATLEPCAPGSRRHPKMGCAERIVQARIKKVWIGIEDPDPMVDRKGIRFLQDNGIEVSLFDQDLQEIIKEKNRQFLSQAIERAEFATQAKTTKEIILSSLECALPGTNESDLSIQAIQQYVSTLGKTNAEPDTVRHLLVRQGILSEVSGEFLPTGFGFLLFGDQPREILPQAGLLATLELPGGGEELSDFVGPMVLVPQQVETWLRARIPIAIDRSTAKRGRTSGFPFELIREGIVNALIHRDYDIVGARCQLVITPETIEIRSPGRPILPVTFEQLQTFKAPALSRNPKLHFVFEQIDLAEARGLGMKSLRSIPAAIGLPLPKFSWEDPYVVLTLYRSSESAVTVLDSHVQAALSNDEQAGWKFLSTKTDTTQSEYASHFGLEARTAQRHLRKFVENGLLRRIGRGPTTRYEIVRS